MFRCQLCSQVVCAGNSAHHIILKSRRKRYPFRKDADTVKRLSERGRMRKVKIDDLGGSGHEIAQEILACRECAQKHSRPELQKSG